ncbi:helix-turn-helix domain-containing protein [Methylotenera versatilis]|uniref:helix-turn-helix domain-containing protein n=1 Tax=Methylotenera versatilis TaxID=1055487 RepID=UPI000647E7C4|nr:helix-turn-helix transcriptional regulator [Methylotenera versatilis]
MSVSQSNQDDSWRIKMLEQGLAHLGQALIIVSSRAEVLFASSAAEVLLKNQHGLRVVNQQLTADLAPDNTRLQKAIHTAIDANHTQENSISIYVHRSEHPKPYYLSISSMQKQEDERRDGHSVLILVKDLSLNYEYWTDRLSAEFNLSRREVECVVLLTERRSTKEVSEVMGISTETVRQYIKNVFKKMDVQKQHELVSMALEYRRNR